MNSQDPCNDGQPVVAEVEVVYFNLSRTRGLVVGALAAGVNGRRSLLRGPMASGEQPAETAVRLLEGVADVRTALHPPVLVSARAAPHRQAGGPTLTLSYVVLGTVPSNSSQTWTFSVGVEDGELPLDQRIDDADAVHAARRVAARLLDELSLAPALLPTPNKPFTLADLKWVYTSIIGPEWRSETANFRRKVEQTPGLVERVPASNHEQSGTPMRGRPPIWYVRGNSKQAAPRADLDDVH